MAQHFTKNGLIGLVAILIAVSVAAIFSPTLVQAQVPKGACDPALAAEGQAVIDMRPSFPYPVEVTCAVLSPSGRYLAFAGFRREGEIIIQSVFAYDRATKELLIMTGLEWAQAGAPIQGCGQPIWHPTADRLFFIGDRRFDRVEFEVGRTVFTHLEYHEFSGPQPIWSYREKDGFPSFFVGPSEEEAHWVEAQ